MRITVKLFATFRNNRFMMAGQEHPEGSVCRGVIEGLGLTEAELGVVMVNGRHASLDQVLREGDTLSLFPLIGGG
jgi:molybdopterin converting factor small subunit